LASQDVRARPVAQRAAFEAQISTKVLRQDSSRSPVHHRVVPGKRRCRFHGGGVTPMAIKRTKKADPVHVVVKVDGRRWRRVLSLSGSRSDDRHYVLETRPNGSATVQFGDGAHGASASKASRVEITYRTGGGGAGNVRLCLRRTARPTRDLALWVAIRNRTHAVNFGG
jgi:hypothetical protein